MHLGRHLPTVSTIGVNLLEYLSLRIYKSLDIHQKAKKLQL